MALYSAQRAVISWSGEAVCRTNIKLGTVHFLAGHQNVSIADVECYY